MTLFRFCCFLFLLPTVCFASTRVVISNNTSDRLFVDSALLESHSNFAPNRDFFPVHNHAIAPYLSNFSALKFNSNDHLMSGQKYHYKTTIKSLKYSGKSLSFYITAMALPYGSVITDAHFDFPNGRHVVLSPLKMQSFNMPFWGDRILRFVPITTDREVIPWPSFVLVVDQRRKVPSASSANAFRAISYNTQLFPFYGDVVNPPNDKKTRADHIPNLIGGDYDVVALTEVFDHDLRNKIINKMKFSYPYFVDAVGLKKQNFLSGGVVVFSKWPIFAHDEMIYQSCTAEDCLSNKGATYIKIKKNVNNKEQVYHIFATHLQAKNPENKLYPLQQIREQQINQLHNFIQSQQIPHRDPVIVAGDFNVDAYDPIKEKFNGQFPQTEYEYLLETLNAADPKQTGLKYSADATLNTMLALSSRSHAKIDYILSLKDYAIPVKAINNVHVLRDTLTQKMYPCYDTSDHFPITGEFLFDDHK